MTLIGTKQSEYSVSFPVTFNINLYVEAEEGLSTQEVLKRIAIDDVAEAGKLSSLGWDAASAYQDFKKQPNFGEIKVEEEPVHEAEPVAEEEPVAEAEPVAEEVEAPADVIEEIHEEAEAANP